MRYLIICEGWIGDILFTASAAQRLKEREPECFVGMWIPLVQPKLLLEENPYIDAVHFGMTPESLYPQYDAWYPMPRIRQDEPATYQFQRACGIDNPTLPFDVYTVPRVDEFIRPTMEDIRKVKGKPIVTYQANWDFKSKLYTKDEYETRRWSGQHRNIPHIVSRVEAYATMLPIGFPEHIHQRHVVAHNAELYAQAASMIKFSDLFVGAEGGLSNLACAVGTKVVMTTDHNWLMFGPRGIMAQYEYLEMGPATYYPNGGHVHLSPYLTDDEVADQIIEIITQNEKA